MAIGTSPTKAALELTMWRPTPEKPDLVGSSSPTESSQSFSKVESFKAVYPIVLDKESESNRVKSAANNSNCTFDGCLQHKMPKNGDPHVIEFKHKITTSIMTEAILSAQLMMWRPTPEKPDFAKTNVALETFDAHFVLGPAESETDIELKPEPKGPVCFVLKQIGHSSAARILELTVNVKLT